MGFSNEIAGRRNASWHRTSGFLSPVVVLGWAAAAQGQSIFVSPDQTAEQTRSVEQAAATRLGSISAPPLRQPSAPEAYPLHWGPIRFHPTLGYQIVHGEGILREANAPGTTVLQTITPGLAMELGRFWDLIFGASIDRYSNAEFKNSTGYSLALSGNIPREKWILSFGYGWSMTEQPQVETGTQTPQQSHSLRAGAVYNYNTRLSYDFGVSQNTQITEQFSDHWTWSTSEWINYHATPKTTLGLGLTAGYNLVDPGANSIYESLQGRFTWQVAERLSFQGTAGIQVQHFLAEGGGGSTDSPSGLRQQETETSLFPIFGLSTTYQIFTSTSLSLGASRQIGNSALTGLFTESTDIYFGLRQRLFKRIFFDLRPSYSIQKYRATFGRLSIEREDEVTAVYAGLSTQLFKKLHASIFYQFSENSSTEDDFSFDSTQIGMQLNYRY
jgi:hypothetical protein